MNLIRNLVAKKNPKTEEKPHEDIPPAQPNHHDGDHAEDQHDNQEDRKKLWSKVSGLIGKDTTSLLSLPVSMFEPMSVLQNMCEPLRHHEIIEKACEAEDSLDRLCLVASFCVALFGGYNRTVKPFNPTLGETYEFVPQHKRYKCLCEQVSHHPPVGIAYSTADNWTLQQESRIETTFWGNSLDIFSVGNNDLKLTNRGEHYMWTNPATCVHNIIFGRMWVERIGTLPIKNLTTGETCTITYKKAGWFEGMNYDITGEARDKDGNLHALITGKYNEAMYVTKVDQNGHKAEPVMIWKKPVEDISNKWKWPPFLFELTATDPEYEAILPPTDSRLRGDVRALQANNVKLAGREKNKIEESERIKRKEREAKGDKWAPVYFEKKPGETDKETRWNYVENYWEERDQRIEQYNKSKQSAPLEESKNTPEEPPEEQQSPRSP